MADSIQISVQGSHTHFAPAERCIVSFQVSKEGDSQASVVQAVTTLSDDLTDLFRSLCPKDTATGRLAVEYVDDPNVAITHWSMSSLSTSNWKVQAGKNGEKEKSARRYRASTGFFVKFKDFAKMSEICSDLAVSHSREDWTTLAPPHYFGAYVSNKTGLTWKRHFIY